MGVNVVSYRPVGYTAVITLNRPDKLNSINDAMFDCIGEAFERALREDMRIVVLRGRGAAFSVGQDLSTEGTSRSTPLSPMSAPLTPNERHYCDQYYTAEAERRHCLERIFHFPRLTIARVHGYCLGLGCTLAMMCTYLICSKDAVFGDPSVRMGNVSANPLWIYRVGLRKAKELLLTGRYIDGTEAEEIGLVDRAVPREQLNDTIEELVNTIMPKGDLVGYDAQIVAKHHWNRVGKDAAGLATAWDFAANYAALSQIQRFGFHGDFDFWKVRADSGWKEAVKRRDQHFDVLFPPPVPSQ